MSNYIKEIKINRPIEIEEPILDLKLLKKKTNAHTPSGLMLKYAKQFRENKNFLMAKLFQELYTQVRNMETSEKIRIESWRGKSGIKIFEEPSKFICITYKKADKGEEPKEIKKEILKEDVNKLIFVLNSFENKSKIPTSEIAEKFYKKSWKHEIYGDRDSHISLCYMLNILEQKEKIKYSRKGFTTIIKDLDYFEVKK